MENIIYDIKNKEDLINFQITHYTERLESERKKQQQSNYNAGAIRYLRTQLFNFKTKKND